MTTDPSRQIWKAGVALSDAWLHFAEQAVREEHESKPGFTGTLQHLVAVAQSTRDGKKILSALQEVGKAHLDKLESRKLLQDALIEVLANDDLIASGYLDKGKKAAPVSIDPSFFGEASADWDNDLVRLNGTTYERVRITDPAAVAKVLSSPAVPVVATEADVSVGTKSSVKADKLIKKAKLQKPKAKKASAKPTKKVVEVPAAPEVTVAAPAVKAASAEAQPVRSKAGESIHAALEKLVAAESGFADLNRRSAAQMIRDELHATYEKGNGLSDPNLARYIRRKCGLRTVKH